MLNGLRVIEIEGLGPAPFAARHLAQLGADVIVVHRKGGQASLAKPDELDLDRGKRSIALDLKDAEDNDILWGLLKGADVLIEGMRPGVMERLGFGPKKVQACVPQLVYGRMTGWGQTGPRAQQAGHDLNYIALSGALWYASPAGQIPQTPPTLVGDIGGGALYLLVGILAGVFQARQSGVGTVVDAAIVDGAAHMMGLLTSMGPYLSEERGKSLLDGPHWSRCYACSDGRHISVQCLEPKFYQVFLDCLGLQKDPRFADQYVTQSWPEQIQHLERLFLTQPQKHWCDVFEGTDACVAPVLSPLEAADDPHMKHRNAWAEGRRPNLAPRFSNYMQTHDDPCKRDAHRSEILKEIGKET